MRNFLLLLMFLLFCAFANLAYSNSIEVSGEVSGIWEVDTVCVTGDLLIQPGETLIIDAGVCVLFQGHYNVVVRGSVVAIGTFDVPIRFTSADTTGFSDTLSVAGGWGGFFYEHLDPDTDSSFFSYCIFSYGKTAMTGDTNHYYGGAFRIFDFHKIRFSKCWFEHNRAYRWGGAIFIKNAHIFISTCTFTDNRCGRMDLPYGYGGALCVVSANPIVQYNTFKENQSTGVGGGASFEHADPVVHHNIFEANYSGLGGGLCYLRTIPVHPCSNNLIIGNEARFFGGGIAVLRANTHFVNNTIANNLSVYGGAYYCNDSAFPSNYNCLFYNNFAYEGVEVYIWDIRSAPNFYCCNVPGDTSGFAGSGGHEGYHGIYQQNFDTVPDFVENSPYPFQLKSTSPMRDVGQQDTTGLFVPALDLAGNPRIYNHRIDIGAYEWNPGPGIAMLERNSFSMKLFPNPAQERVYLEFTLKHASNISYALYKLNGTLIWTTSEKPFHAGNHHTTIKLQTIDNQRLEAGIYLLQLATDFGRFGQKLFVRQ